MRGHNRLALASPSARTWQDGINSLDVGYTVQCSGRVTNSTDTYTTVVTCAGAEVWPVARNRWRTARAMIKDHGDQGTESSR